MENKTGVINIRKEKGYTSHDVVAIIRKLTREKTGHTGTLDPDAMGVLPICLGRATKLADYFAASDKTYIAEIILGITTDTGDISGEILTKKEAMVTFEELKTIAESFKYENRGAYLQTPPMYSAIKIGGKKLYELARKGQTVERPARPVKVYDIKVSCENNRFFIETTCSKGTYIRGLCMDIGEALGCGAAMGELTRTRSGNFLIENSVSLAEVRAATENSKLDKLILPVDKLLPYPDVFVKPEGIARALNGNPLTLELLESDKSINDNNEKFWLKSSDNRIIGLYSLKNETFRAEVML